MREVTDPAPFQQVDEPWDHPPEQRTRNASSPHANGGLPPPALQTGFRSLPGMDPRLSRRQVAGSWTRNMTEPAYFNDLTAQPGGSGLIVGEPGDPRTLGITLAVQF